MLELYCDQMRIVIAFGGNAIKKAKEKGTAAEQFNNVRDTCNYLLELIEDHDIVITHGNGPQVGSILIQQESGEPYVPGMPLDICVAESQGLIGYMIQQSLKNILQAHNIHRSVVTVITQVVVDKNDPAFTTPTKPVGPFYSRERAEEMEAKGISIIEDAGRGYRRVVPSPNPQSVVEADVIESLLEQGMIVIGVGGGGVPVHGSQHMEGVEAVVDKDLASEVLAESIKADWLIILTDVKHVALNYRQKNQKNLRVLTIEEAETYLAEGHFPPGSMGPKIQAAIRFLKAGGKKVIITSPRTLSEALKGKKGTEIISAKHKTA